MTEAFFKSDKISANRESNLLSSLSESVGTKGGLVANLRKAISSIQNLSFRRDASDLPRAANLRLSRKTDSFRLPISKRKLDHEQYSNTTRELFLTK